MRPFVSARGMSLRRPMPGFGSMTASRGAEDPQCDRP